jgi:predicted aspartyl protease
VRRTLALTALIGSLGSALPISAAGGAAPRVPLAIDVHGGIAIPVLIGDAGPFDFILDTGASRSIISDDLARQLGAPRVARSEVVTSAGTEWQSVVRLAGVSVGSARIESLLAPVVPPIRLSALGAGIRGLLGQDFLSAFNYTLDYRRHHLQWDDRDACADPAAVRLISSEGRFVMALPQGASRPALRLVPDTGAEALVLFRAPGRDPSPVPAAEVMVTGLVGDLPARAAVVPRLVVGGVTLRDRPAVVVERDEPNADGLLPLHGFSSVSFGARGACVVVRK